MLPKKERLPAGSFLGSGGKVRRSRLFSLKSFPPALPYSRFGAIVGKKVEKTAVGRNRVRRMIFDCIGRSRDAWPPGDHLVIALSGMRDASEEELYGELIRHIAL